MSNTYPIRNSRGNIITTIGETQRDRTTTSVVLHGRGATEYGLQRDENLVHVLENFSSSTPPSNPIDGQLWWDTSADEFNVWNEDLGSPIGSGDWVSVIPSAAGVGFFIFAGDGLVSDPADGFPANSPQGITLDVDAGNGLTFSAGQLVVNLGSGLVFNAGAIDVDSSTIDHDALLNFVANEHIDHLAVVLTAGDGLDGGGDITENRTFNVDSTVVRTSGAQSIGGVKTFTSAINAADGSLAAPGYSFSGNTGLGMRRQGANSLGFITNTTLRLQIESNGTLNVAGTSNYETLVTDDDDIPNKKYVDDTISSSSFRGAHAYRTTSFAFPRDDTGNFASEAVVGFNAESFDTDTIHDNATNNTRLTVPSGVSKVRLKAGFTSTGDTSAGLRHLRVRKNGGTGSVDTVQPSWIPLQTSTPSGTGSLWGMMIDTGIINTTGGSYFELYAMAQAGNTTTTANSFWFEMEIIE